MIVMDSVPQKKNLHFVGKKRWHKKSSHPYYFNLTGFHILHMFFLCSVDRNHNDQEFHVV